MTMLQMAPKLGSVLSLMRWELIEFDWPVLAYSDHPVVVWPAAVTSSDKPFERQGFGPVGALEVRAPLSPRLAVLMTWVDESDRRIMLPAMRAGGLNALTIGQADQEWMHQLGDEPPIASGPLSLLTADGTWLQRPGHGAFPSPSAGAGLSPSPSQPPLCERDRGRGRRQ